MKSFCVLTLLWLVSIVGYAQKNYSYWIQFSDKKGCGYELSAPESFLSKRSILRRQNQNIAIDSTDLPVSKSYVAAVLACGPVSFLHGSRYLNGITVSIPASDLPECLEKMKRLPFVVNVECTFNPLRARQHLLKLRKPVAARVLSSNFGYGNAYPQIKMHNGEWLHQLDYWGKGKIIAVLDGGFLNVDKIYAYERAWGNNQILGQKDFTGDADDFFLKNRHGSQVFSLMAAYDYGRFVGTAPESSYWLIKTEVPEYEAPVEMDNLVAGIEFADSVGADILTASLGYCAFGDDSSSIDKSKLNGKFYRASIAESLAAKKGMVVVNSVGNKGKSSWEKFTVPADAVGILAVGSVDENGNHCIFSGVGPTADNRYAPDVCSLGQSVAVLDENGNPSVSSGTSLSTPIIAGLTACLWQALPHLSAVQIVNLIKKNASKSLSPDFELGYGVPDFYAAYIQGRSSSDLSEKPLNISVDYNPRSKELSFHRDSLQQLKSDLLLFNDAGENVWRKSTRYSAMKFRLTEIPAGRYSLFVKINNSVAYYQILNLE